MAFVRSWRDSVVRGAAAVVAAALCLSARSLKREQAEDASGAQWRTGVVETADNAKVEGADDRDSHIAMCLMGGGGLAFALGTEKDLGKASVWRYLVRDGETPVRPQSFAVFRPDDCVRYTLGGNPADTPMEKLPRESCPAN